MIRHQKTSNGFALPTVLIVSVIMLIVLISSIAAAASIRSAIDNQYYDQLARETAEAGLARAQGCLQQSASIATWTDAKPLTPWTNCSGDPLTSGETCPESAASNIKAACGVIVTSSLRTYFSVPAPLTSPSGVQILTATSTVNMLRSTDKVTSRVFEGSSSASVGANVAISYTAISNAQPNGGLGVPLSAQSFSFGSDGNVYGLGYNGFGILGDGTLTNALTPVKFQLPGALKAQSVAVNALSGGLSAYVVTTDGQVYGAGVNNNGQLGNGTTATKQSTPVKFNLPSGKKAAKVSVLGESTFVITQDGEVYGAGLGTSGQLGNGLATTSSTPVKMNLPVGQKAVAIECDWRSVYVLTESGKAYMTGINDWGQAGNGTNTQVNTPIQFTTGGNSGQPTVRQVVTDGVTGWVLLSDGTIYGAGRSMYGALGNNTIPVSSGSWQSTPVQFQIGTERAIQIATDYGNLVAVTDDGDVYGSGYNQSGELGCGDTTQRNVPCKASMPSGKVAKSLINTGYGIASYYGNNTFVLTADGKAYGMGDNNYGQLGVGVSGSPRTTPQLVIMPTGISAQSIRAGTGTTVILGSDSRVYAVGNNSYGQLGTGNTTNLSTPTATNYLNLRPSILF